MITFNHKTLNIKIKTISSNTFDVNIDSNSKVNDLKKEIEKLIKKERKGQRLIFQGKVMKDDAYLTEYKLDDGDVIHLVENQQPSLNTDNQSRRIEINPRIQRNERNEGQFNLFQSLYNFSTDNLNNLSANNINSILRENNSNTLTPVPDSFKNLEKRSTFNKQESIEVIKQNINNLKEIINNSANFNSDNNEEVKQLFKINNKMQDNNNNIGTKNSENLIDSSKILFKVGQWVDVKDSVDHWTEGQILDVRNNEVYITLNGWASGFNEWISIYSHRLAIYRTYTIQYPFTKYFSPFPNSKNDSGLIFRDFQDFDKFDSFRDISYFLNEFSERIKILINEKEILFDKKLGIISYYESTRRERNFYFHLMQISPLMDRLGRLLADYANYLFNFSFREFEDDTIKFRENTNYRNIINYNSLEEKLNKKIHSFKDLIQIPVMRNPGEVAESLNLTRPRVGIIIGMSNGEISNTNSNINNIDNRSSREILKICTQERIEISSCANKISKSNKFNQIRIVENFSLTKFNKRIHERRFEIREAYNFALLSAKNEIRDKKEIKNPNLQLNSTFLKEKIIIEARDKDIEKLPINKLEPVKKNLNGKSLGLVSHSSLANKEISLTNVFAYHVKDLKDTITNKNGSNINLVESLNSKNFKKLENKMKVPQRKYKIKNVNKKRE